MIWNPAGLAQGDITALVDNTGKPVVEYTYDAWGKPLNTTGDKAGTLGKKNPLRYRGYVYDAETGLYYLQSRYYNPEWERFINADEVSEIGANSSFVGYNLYAYCLNNPVNRYDENGNLSLPNWAKVAIGVGVIALAAAATVTTAGAASATLAAAIHCVAAGALEGAATGAIAGAISGAASGAISSRINTGSWEKASQAALDGAVTGFMTGAITGAIEGGISFLILFYCGYIRADCCRNCCY